MTKQISIVHIQQALQINVTAGFVADTLNIKPVSTEKRAMFWSSDQFQAICKALTAHIADALKHADFDVLDGKRKPPKAKADEAVADPFAESEGADPFAEDPFAEATA